MDFDKQRRIMVDSQVRVNDVTEPSIVSAFLNVPREKFVSKSAQSIAYSETEIKAGDNRAMWTPRDLGKMLRALEPQSGDLALVIGAGAGYSSALLGRIVETVIAFEDSPEAVELMTERFASIGMDQAIAVEGDLAKGLPDQGPFEIILIAGMVETVPQAWLEQLAEGGRLGVVVSEGRSLGTARVYTKAGDSASYREVFECCPPVLPGFEKAETFVF
ncbi:MAG: protein-L-isoaspartate O-methyltransferase [Henriciella sp.]|nr:protein-L-isoaspartate O-methyltransferase [Henriciella sp.]